MKISGRPISRLFLLGGFLFCISAAPQAGLAPAAAPSVHGAEPLTRYMYPEVRLRKLHLVRPDLIPYPIAYEVYC